MAEEVQNASTIVPWAIISTLIFNGVTGLAFLLAMLFCLGDIDNALESPTGFPFIEIFVQATNSNAGATVMVCLILFLLIAGATGATATASRLLWSLARDNGVPLSKYIGKVNTPKSYVLSLRTVYHLKFKS